MINEEKVILMTRASLYEEKQKKKALKISKYFRHDYISLQLLKFRTDHTGAVCTYSSGLFLSAVRSMFLPLQSGQKKCGKLCSDFKEDLRYL